MLKTSELMNFLPKSLMAIVLCSCYLTVCNAVAEDASPSQARDMENFGPVTNLMFWKPREKLAGFRNIDKFYSTRKIERGNKVYPLPVELVDLSAVTYEVEGKRYSTDDFLKQNRVAGLLVIKNGRIVTERYQLGNTETTRWISFSVAKSVVSMLTGAAIQDGYIKSVDDLVTDYIPHLKGSSYADATIRDVLHMASGTEWNEDYADPKSDVNNMPGGILNLVKVLGSKPRVAAPGEKFNYNTAETNLMGAIVRAAIGNNLATYLTHKIWVPFGMESDATWLLHGPGQGETGGCCINATLRDYARIGLFAMQKGVLADGTRILPEGWMKESTTPSKGNEGYGYLWWLGRDYYAALGVFGQLIHINPDQNLVIAAHSAWNTAGSRAYYMHRTAFVAAVTAYLK
jgi:CubicO group peptidase (beta-lactamase class C family)|tara:strand:- start:2078 stop:3283 length:1206 start_codon:yes stop_codon:yes gene_type:complete